MVRRVLYVGTNELSHQKARAVALSQLLSLSAFVLFSIVVAFLFYLRGWTTTVMITFCAIATLLLTFTLNILRFHNWARLLLAIVIPLTVALAIFLPRFLNPQATFTYARSPEVYSILIAGSIIPMMIFVIRERGLFLVGFLVNLFVLLAFEPVLYHLSGGGLPPYSVLRFFSANLVVLIMYLFLNGSVYFIKKLYEQFESKNQQLITLLHQKNTELLKANDDLSDLNREIKLQNEEIQAQSEELIQSTESLGAANREIERHKVDLEAKNELLAKSLDEKSLDLLQTNKQLISHNNELQQFSYTVSHNLRGPVASIQGLINIHDQATTEWEKNEIFQLLVKSVQSLETIIRDLGKIIEIRTDKFATDEPVDLQQEVDLIAQSLSTFIQRGGVSISTDLQKREIVSVKPYINSILYNLISNAIQYRAPNRPSTVHVSSRCINSTVMLEVADNGLGIDLRRFGSDIFKLYKRFHTHTQGKGLGLFIVKQQVEQLNGKIEVESAPDAGTTFKIYLDSR